MSPGGFLLSTELSSPSLIDLLSDFIVRGSKTPMNLDQQIKWVRRAAITFGIVGFVPLGFGIYRHLTSPYLFDLADLGTFVGGTSGPLWSLGALTALYLGFLGQRKDIRLQEKTFERQQFEDNFYRLLEIYEEEAERLRTETTDKEINSVTSAIESTIEDLSLYVKADKYFDHDQYLINDGVITDTSGKQTLDPHLTEKVKEIDLIEDEREKIVHRVIYGTIVDNSEMKVEVNSLMNVHSLLIELLDEANDNSIEVEKHLKLLSGKTRRSEKRLIYWLTYELEDFNSYAELVDKYGFIDSLEEPDDFSSLDDAIR